MFDPSIWNDEVLLRASQLTNRPGKPGLLGISNSSLYRLLAEPGAFPKPVRPLPGVVAWRAGDVRAWLKSKSAK
jgi:predicted DNA-binding transcriptional regulator AlpA